MERLVDVNLLEASAPETVPLSRSHSSLRPGRRRRRPRPRSNATPYSNASCASTLLSPGLAEQELRDQPADRPRDNAVHAVACISERRAGHPLARCRPSQSEWIATTRVMTTGMTTAPLIPELTLALFGYHELRSRWVEMSEMCGAALAGSRVWLGLHSVVAWLQHDHAIPEVESGSLEIAADRLLRALEMFCAIPDRHGQARVLYVRRARPGSTRPGGRGDRTGNRRSGAKPAARRHQGGGCGLPRARWSLRPQR